MRFYCALAVSATIRVILTKILNRSRIAVQWNGGLTDEHAYISVKECDYDQEYKNLP